MGKNGEKKARKILSRIDRRFILVGPIEKQSDKPVFLVNDRESGENAVLKCSESDPNLPKRLLKYLFGTSAARTERALYKWFSHQEFEYFRTPRLLGCYKANLLISFEERIGDSIERDNLVSEALHEFYRKCNKFRIWGAHNIFQQARYSSITSNTRALFQLRPEIKKEVFWGVIKLIRYCYSEQKPLKNYFWLHNDFSANNVLHSGGNDYPVIIDFQAAIKEKRWLLNDIVRYAFTGDQNIIDFNIVRKFIENIDSDYYGNQLSIEIQLRYALLCRTLQSLLWKEKQHIFHFLKSVVLDDNTFSDWYLSQLGPVTTNLHKKDKSIRKGVRE